MALVLADRVKETTTTTGTTDFVLSGADTGFQTFSAGVGANNTTYYAVALGSDFEIGLGTLSSDGLTLARTTVLQSSNSDNKVSFAAGSKYVFVTYPADKAVLTDATQTLTNKTLNSPTFVTPVLGTPSSGTLTNCTFPTLNQNTTGTASNVTGTVAIANGGTGATTRQDAMDALAGSTTSGQYLRGNGTDVVMAAIQAGDVPTLNQNTTGTASNVTGTVAVANGGTGQTSYTDGQLLIGNSTGNTLTKATLTAGSGITITNGTGSISIAASGGGDVAGPASSTDNAIARFDSTTGKIIQNSTGILTDAGALSGLTDITATGLVRTSGSGFQNGNTTDSFAKFVYDGGNAALNITNEYNSGGAGGTYGQIVFKNYNSNGGTLTERARISGGGYFKASNNGGYLDSTGSYHEIRQTNGSNQGIVLTCTDASYTSIALQIRANRNTTDDTFYVIRYFNDGAGAYKFNVADSGNVTNTNGSYGTISDVKMKTDIVDAGSQWADIKAIRFRKYKMKDDPSGLLQLGVVAQELEQTSPGLISEHKDYAADVDADGKMVDLGTTTKSVKTSILFMKAAVALQEAMTRIEQLEARLDAANL